MASSSQDPAVTYTPVVKTSSAATNRLSRAFLSPPGDLTNLACDDIGDGIGDYDDDDEEEDDDDDMDDEDIDASNNKSRSGRAEDPSKYKLEIRIAGPNDKDDVLALSNETLWDIFDLVFECENYHSLTKTVYSPDFRKSMKHQYNLSRNTLFAASNPKFARLWGALASSAASAASSSSEARLAASLVPALSSAQHILEDEQTPESDPKFVAKAVRSWLSGDVTPQLASLWADLDAEASQQQQNNTRPKRGGIPGSLYIANLLKETEFIESINRDAARRKKLMDAVVIDLASIVSIGASSTAASTVTSPTSSSSSSSSSSTNSQMTTMGPLLAAKMVSDTLPIAHISRFIPHLARYLYAKNITRLNSLLLQQIKDTIVDNVPELPEPLERAMASVNDFEALTLLYSRYIDDDVLSPLSPTVSLLSAIKMDPSQAATSVAATPSNAAASGSSLSGGIRPLRLAGASASPSSESTSSVSSHSTNRYSIPFFPNTHRRTVSYSSVATLPNVASSPGGSSRTPSYGSQPPQPSSPATALQQQLQPSNNILSSAGSALANLDVSSATPLTPEEEQTIIGPLLAPLVALGLVTPNLESIYPDYLSFVSAAFAAWSDVAATTSTPQPALANGIVFGTASSSPPSRQTSVPTTPGSATPLDSAHLPESVRTVTALGGIYLTLAQHGTTTKIPAIGRCFALLSSYAGKVPGLAARDLHALRKKVVLIYTDWVQNQPPAALLVAHRRPSGSLASGGAGAGAAAGASGLQVRKNAATNGGQIKLPVQNSTARVSKQRSISGASTGSSSEALAKKQSATSSAAAPTTTPAPAEGNAEESAPPNLPAPCQKCFHNHKGNNCARKCYVCRMAKLAAQHGHIVELVTALPSGESSTASASNEKSDLSQQQPQPTLNEKSDHAQPQAREKSRERPRNGVEGSRHAPFDIQRSNSSRNLGRNNSVRRPDNRTQQPQQQQQQLHNNHYNNNNNHYNNNMGGSGGYNQNYNNNNNNPMRKNTHRRTYSAANQGPNYNANYNNNLNGSYYHSNQSPGGNSNNNNNNSNNYNNYNNINNNNNNRQSGGGHRRTQSTAASKFGARLNFDS